MPVETDFIFIFYLVNLINLRWVSQSLQEIKIFFPNKQRCSGLSQPNMLRISAHNGPGGPPGIRFMIRIDIHRTKLNIILKKENFHLVTIGK